MSQSTNRSVAELRQILSSQSLRTIAGDTGIGKNRLHRLRRCPQLASFAELIRLADAGYLHVTIT